MIKIHLLGPPRVYRDGELLHIQRRAPRALLFYLAAEAKPVSRFRLGELFWREKLEQHQRNSLRYTLARLRRALGEPNAIHTHLGTISIHRDFVWVDKQEFTRLYLEAQKFLTYWDAAEPLPPPAFERLEKAAGLWYGDEFIAGHDMSVSSELEHWKDEVSRELNAIRVRIFEKLALHDRISNTPSRALHWLRLALTLDEYNERLHKQTLEILLELGERVKARRHYDAMMEKFLDELGVVPSEEIRDLAAKIKSSTTPRKNGNGKAKWNVRRSMTAPFVGQKEALEVLNRVYHTGGGILIRGEAGAGKTRLVQEFYQRLPSPPRLLMLSCHPMEETLPYHPWIETLRASIAPDEWETLARSWAAPLSALLPEVDALRRIAETTLDKKVYARSAIFDAIIHLLSTLSEQEPLLLVVDDAHWADEASLSVLSHLLRESFFSSRTGMLIITARLEVPNPHLNQLVLATDSRLLRQMNMRGLSEEEIAQLGQYLLKKSPSEDFLRRLARNTGGNPFFVVETLKTMISHPEKTSEEILENPAIASSIIRLIQERLETLSPSALEVLSCAAIQGTQFQMSILQAALGKSQKEILDAIDLLQSASFIRWKDGETYVFIHEKIRDALLLELSRARQRALHRAVAEALESQLGEDREKKAAILAHHYEESGQFSRAFDAWVAAGHYAYRLFSVEDAARAYDRAEQLISQADLSDEQIYQLFSLRTLMAFENDDADTLKHLNERLLQIGEARNSPLLTGGAMDGLSDYAMAANRFQEGLEYTKKALRRLQDSGNRLAEANACIHQGVLLYMLNRFQKSKECLLNALEILPENAKDRCFLRARGQAYHQIALVYSMMGEPDKGVDYARRCLRIAREAGWPYGPVAAHAMLGLSYYLLGDYDAGLDASSRGIELAKRIDAWRMLGYLYIYTGYNNLEMGLIGEAWNYAEEARTIGEKWGHYEIIALAQKLVADVYLRLEAIPLAASVAKEGMKDARENFVTLGLKYRYGYALSLMGDDAGIAYIEETLRESQRMGVKSIWIFAKARQLRVFVHRGEFDAFERHAEEVRQLLSGHFNPAAGNLIRYLRAKIEAKQGNLEKALLTNRQLLPLFDETPKFWIEFDTLRLEAYILRKRGSDTSEAMRHIEKHLQKIERSIQVAPVLQPTFEAFKKRKFQPLFL